MTKVRSPLREGLLAIRHLHLVRGEGCQAMASLDRSIATLALQLNLQPAVKNLCDR
jgi:hypothetical protein